MCRDSSESRWEEPGEHEGEAMHLDRMYEELRDCDLPCVAGSRG